MSETNDTVKRPFWKLSVKSTLILLVVLALVIAAVLYWLHARNFESTDDAFIDAHIVRIAPQVAGIVQALPITQNTRVKTGDLLVVINPDNTVAALRQQQAGVMQATAQLAQARAGLSAKQGDLGQIKYQIDSARAEVRVTQQKLGRLQNLERMDSGALVADQLDSARADFAEAKAKLQELIASEASAQADIQSAKENVDAASAQREAAIAREDDAQISLDQYQIRASLPGQIVNMSVNLGSYVSPGTQMMALVPDQIWVSANFKETQLRHIRPGQPVQIEVDAYPGVDFSGKVLSIQRAAGQVFQLLPPQNATGNFVKVVQRVPVIISIKNPDSKRYPIGPGMSVVPTVRVN